VTGAAGFIGSALIWELNQNGFDQIIATDFFKNDLRWKNLSKRKVIDWIRREDLFAFLEKFKPEIDGLFHIGACSSTTETDLDYLLRNNYEDSKNLYNWCLHFNKRFIYASSCATYGDGSRGFSDQTSSHQLYPMNAYGLSKVLFDRWVENQSQKPPQSVGLKFSNVYGPNEYHKGEQSSVIYKAFHQVSSTETIRLFKSHRPDYRDGEQKRDFIYIKDVTRWIYEIWQRPDISGLFNMGFGEANTWTSVADEIFLSMGLPPKIQWIDIPEAIREQYQYFTEARMDSLREYGISLPLWDLKLGIEDYIKNYLRQKDPYL